MDDDLLAIHRDAQLGTVGPSDEGQIPRPLHLLGDHGETRSLREPELLQEAELIPDHVLLDVLTVDDPGDRDSAN